MVAIGSKALPLRRHRACSVRDASLTAVEDNNSRYKVLKNKNMGRKETRKRAAFSEDTSTGNRTHHGWRKSQKFAEDKSAPLSQASFVRKPVDPETAKYFSEIANVIEGIEIDGEERSGICGNALEEAIGKEVELATDYIISHTMQTLLEGCSVENLCVFLQSSAKNFCYIAMDRSGSHVAETALKSLVTHLHDNENRSLIEETLSDLCQAIVVNPLDMMCNCYGSHVLRRLLCLCKGVPLDSSEFHGAKPSVVLAERLNLRSSQLDSTELRHEDSFPDQLKILITEMLNPLRVDIATIQMNQYSSLVVQTALKLLVGQKQELFHVIPILLGNQKENALEGDFIQESSVKKILRLIEENAFSHLMEVILAVAPDKLYGEILTKLFKGSLYKLASHQSGNFVVQALISHARSQDHIELVWTELGTKFKNLLEMGRTGVVAALLAASQRLQTHEQKCCQALVDAVCLENEPSAPMIPRILFIDSYFYSDDKPNWKWPTGAKINVLGSLILQTVFKFPSEIIHAYVTGIISIEDNHIFEASKDPAGARVVEAFLSSSVSAKQKRKLISKLRGHFGELSVHSSGSFTVEKCFNVSNLSLRESIVSELVPLQAELSKTKQGPYLLKKLDIEGFAKRPDQWRSRQTSKQSAYKEFYAAFGAKDSKSSRGEDFLADTKQKSQQEKLKGMRKEIDTRLSTVFTSNPAAPFLSHQNSTQPKKHGKKQKRESRGFSNDAMDGDSSKRKGKRQKNGRC